MKKKMMNRQNDWTVISQKMIPKYANKHTYDKVFKLLGNADLNHLNNRMTKSKKKIPRGDDGMNKLKLSQIQDKL